MAAKNTKSKSVKSLAPAEHKGLGRALELQKKFNAMKTVSTPSANTGKSQKPVKLAVNQGSKGSRSVGFPSGS